MTDTGAAQFQAEWMGLYPGLWPSGWMLREAKALPWIRFHALPESKRYPDDADELAVILARAYDLADAVIGEGASCWIVNIRYEERDSVAGSMPDLFDDDDEEMAWRFRAAPVIWRRGAFDDILAEIADDQGSSLWINRKSGAIFAPYDGGFDLFPGSAETMAALRARYAAWLPSEPSGL